ncbi:hypothetical protein LOAG_11094 [Loa loa]|uniref:Uncharacterized protein n=1 Tax=Loa loa TaxID=7209 RepID=A0A1S0TNM9_LOALO|nr:hypothetical protein LOAG_11094 [Loa loa]EFO17404.1 hypothetical protein LOAG_11094 [Loa loa]
MFHGNAGSIVILEMPHWQSSSTGNLSLNNGIEVKYTSTTNEHKVLISPFHSSQMLELQYKFRVKSRMRLLNGKLISDKKRALNGTERVIARLFELHFAMDFFNATDDNVPRGTSIPPATLTQLPPFSMLHILRLNLHLFDILHCYRYESEVRTDSSSKSAWIVNGCGLEDPFSRRIEAPLEKYSQKVVVIIVKLEAVRSLHRCTVQYLKHGMVMHSELMGGKDIERSDEHIRLCPFPFSILVC